MIWPHRHQWTVHSADYTPPSQMPQTVSGHPLSVEPIQRRMTEGVTHIYLRCETCGTIDEKDVYGKFTPNPNTKDSELLQLRRLAGIE